MAATRQNTGAAASATPTRQCASCGNLFKGAGKAPICGDCAKAAIERRPLRPAEVEFQERVERFARRSPDADELAAYVLSIVDDDVSPYVAKWAYHRAMQRLYGAPERPREAQRWAA